MSLADRIAAAEAARTCAVRDCERHRVPDSLFCRDHLGDMWANRLDQVEGGGYVPRRTFRAKELCLR